VLTSHPSGRLRRRLIPALAVMADFSAYLKNAFRWRRGRQGTGYDKMLLLTAPWPIAFDSYILRYPDGTEIPPHTDPVKERKHFRLNIVLKQSSTGGEFLCENPIFSTSRIKFFRPDLCEHQVTQVRGGSRYVLSVGWLWGAGDG
jgi:hypothetical protein